MLANQQACVLDLEKHRPLKISSLSYPKENFPSPVFDEPFENFHVDFGEEDFQFEQIIRSQMIDMSHHMNNIEYIKLALNIFSDDFFLGKRSGFFGSALPGGKQRRSGSQSLCKKYRWQIFHFHKRTGKTCF